MSYSITLLSGAEEDINHAYNWYEDQKPGLGEEFLDELVACYKKLEQYPASFTKLNKTYRQLAVRRFPYVIVYEVHKQDVVIYAVFHTSRNPKNKLRRK